MLTLMGFQLVPLVEILSTALMVTAISLLLVMVNPSHVVLHAGVCDKGLRAPINQTLVWFFSAVIELMSGELITSAKALVTVLTGEWFQSCVFAKMSL